LAYRCLTDTFFELIKAYSISEKELRARVTIDNFDNIATFINNNQPVLLLGAHTAPAEWIGQAGHLHLGCYIDPVYKPAHSKLIDRFLFAVRSRYESTPIPYKNLAKDIVARKNVKRCVGILADLAPRRREQVLNVDFLNQSTRFFLSIERIAKLADMPVFFIAAKCVRRGHYKLTIHKLCEHPHELDAGELTRKYAQCVEELIQQKPEAWLWTHRRWKHAALN